MKKSTAETIKEIDKEIAYQNVKLAENLANLSKIYNEFLPHNAALLKNSINTFQSGKGEETESHVRELQDSTLNLFTIISRLCDGIIGIQQYLFDCAIDRRNILEKDENSISQPINIISLADYVDQYKKHGNEPKSDDIEKILQAITVNKSRKKTFTLTDVDGKVIRKGEIS